MTHLRRSGACRTSSWAVALDIWILFCRLLLSIRDATFTCVNMQPDTTGLWLETPGCGLEGCCSLCGMPVSTCKLIQSGLTPFCRLLLCICAMRHAPMSTRKLVQLGCGFAGIQFYRLLLFMQDATWTCVIMQANAIGLWQPSKSRAVHLSVKLVQP